MSRRVAQLDDKALEVKHEPLSDPYAIQFIPKVFERLRDKGYPVEDVLSAYNAVSLKEDGNSGYQVMEIETLEYPAEDADAVEDKIRVWVCTCPGWLFHHNEDFPEEKRPSELDECPHVEKCKRKERQAVDDENQTDFGDL